MSETESALAPDGFAHDTSDPCCKFYDEPECEDDEVPDEGHCTVCCDGWCMS